MSNIASAIGFDKTYATCNFDIEVFKGKETTEKS